MAVIFVGSKDIKCNKDKDNSKIEKGELRIGIESPSPFAEDKMMTKWYHPKCFWQSIKRSRSAKMITSTSDFSNFDDLEDEDKRNIAAEVREFKSSASAARKKKMAGAQVPVTQFFKGKGPAHIATSSDVARADRNASSADTSGKFSEFCALCISVEVDHCLRTYRLFLCSSACPLQADSSHLSKTKLIKEYVDHFDGDILLLFKLLLPHKALKYEPYAAQVNNVLYF